MRKVRRAPISIGRTSLAVCAAALVLTGSPGCAEDDSGSTFTTEVDRATVRMQQFVAAQQRQLQQSAQATSYGQVASTYHDYVVTQQRAEQDLQALQSDQALADYYAARARHTDEMTQIIRDQMARQAEQQRIYEQRRELERLERERLEQQRYEQLYEEERRRQEQLEDPYE